MLVSLLHMSLSNLNFLSRFHWTLVMMFGFLIAHILISLRTGESGSRLVIALVVRLLQNSKTPFEFQVATSTIPRMEKVRISDPMRLFTLVVLPIFVGIGVMAIASGNSDGWLIAGFFGLCLLVAIFEPWFAKPWVSCDYRLVMNKDEIACEQPRRQRESIKRRMRTRKGTG